MKTLRMVVDLTYDDLMMHNGDEEPDVKEWFYEDILGGELSLHSSEIGDTIGTITIVEIKK